MGLDPSEMTGTYAIKVCFSLNDGALAGEVEETKGERIRKLNEESRHTSKQANSQPASQQ
jgi:hypothetical protein